MKTIFTKKTVAIAIAAVLIATVTVVFVNVYGNRGPVTGIANAVSKPIKTLASALTRAFESIYGNIYKYDRLVEDYEKALSEIAELRQNYSEAIGLAEENAEFRALFGFHERHTDHTYEKAYIESRSSSNWTSSFTIDKGSANSDTQIKVGDSVITAYGFLIGCVTDVGPRTSTVVSVIDTTFSASVYVGEGRNAVTAKGDFSLMGRGLLKVDYIGDETPVVPGDAVITSGLGSRFPAGLIIGEIVEVFNHSTGIGQYATVRMTLPLENISTAFVITDFKSA